MPSKKSQKKLLKGKQEADLEPSAKIVKASERLPSRFAALLKAQKHTEEKAAAAREQKLQKKNATQQQSATATATAAFNKKQKGGAQASAASNKSGVNANTNQAAAAATAPAKVNELRIRPNESLAAFNSRVEQVSREAQATASVGMTRKAEKRREHNKKRAEKKRNAERIKKGLPPIISSSNSNNRGNDDDDDDNDDSDGVSQNKQQQQQQQSGRAIRKLGTGIEDFSQLRDNVRFNEVADAPPVFKTLPKAVFKRAAPENRARVDLDQIEAEAPGGSDDDDNGGDRHANKRRKTTKLRDMPLARQRLLLSERQAAIEQYRANKQRQIELRNASKNKQ
ncbi:hypothetical protein GQ42DRAFT_163306 [Ramicandelaber brevisporus]|nr:hypothetical protein GQ42DRAFT_163306 [Ramicandelaber brevisporus]